MRLLAVGDIHGCVAALRALMRYVDPRPEDRLVTLGDYVNRGPDSRGVIEWLIGYAELGRLVPLRGNHEVMMLAAREDQGTFEQWLAVGGKATLASYGSSGRSIDELVAAVPEAHWRFLEQTRAYFETKSHFFVHANVYPDYPLEEQPDFMLYWEKFDDSTGSGSTGSGPPPHESGKTMICGHTPQRSGRPRNIGHAVCIDTHAHAGGWLTCLDVRSGVYWQANESGETRRGDVEEVDD